MEYLRASRIVAGDGLPDRPVRRDGRPQARERPPRTVVGLAAAARPLPLGAHRRPRGSFLCADRHARPWRPGGQSPPRHRPVPGDCPTRAGVLADRRRPKLTLARHPQRTGVPIHRGARPRRTGRPTWATWSPGRSRTSISATTGSAATGSSAPDGRVGLPRPPGRDRDRETARPEVEAATSRRTASPGSATSAGRAPSRSRPCGRR